MPRTTVDIKFALKPMEFGDIVAMMNDKELIARMQALTADLESAVTSEARLPTLWADDFPPYPTDREYVKALGAWAEKLNVFVVRDAGHKLLGLKPTPADFKQRIKDQAGAPWASLASSGCEVRTEFESAARCNPCNKLCHQCGVKIYTACPPNGQELLIWTSISNGGTVRYQVVVNYKFILVSG